MIYVYVCASYICVYVQKTLVRIAGNRTEAAGMG